MSEGIEIIRRGTSNPLLVVSTDRVMAWLRSVADECGFSEYPICAVQINVDNPFGDGLKFHSEVPTLVVMVSNVPRVEEERARA